MTAPMTSREALAKHIEESMSGFSRAKRGHASMYLPVEDYDLIVAALRGGVAQAAPLDEDHPDCVTDREHELYDALMGLSSAITARQGWSKWVQGGVQIAPIVHKALRLHASPVPSTDQREGGK